MNDSSASQVEPVGSAQPLNGDTAAVPATEMPDETGISLNRLLAFSDGVFAIAITLLSLQFRLPHFPHSPSGHDVARKLLAQAPHYYSYALSFAVVGIFWMAHHRMFRYIKRADITLLWMNLLLLMFIAFLPFPSEIEGEFGDTQPAAILYALSLALAGLASSLIWWHASTGHRLVDPDLDENLIRHMRMRSLATPIVMFASIGISFFSVLGAELSWTALFFFHQFAAHHYGRLGNR